MYPYHNPYYRVVNRIEEERGERRESKISCVFRPEFSFRGTKAFRGEEASVEGDEFSIGRGEGKRG